MKLIGFIWCFLPAFVQLNAQFDMESIAKQEILKHRDFFQNQNKRDLKNQIDVLFAELYIQPNLNNGRIEKGSVLYVFKALNTINSLTIDLRQELKVDSIIFKNQRIGFTRSNEMQIRIVLTQNIDLGNIDSIKICYSGTPNMSKRAYFRSVTASGPNIATLSQPYGAHYWWPSFENLNDKIDSININLLVDTPFVGVSNGNLVNTDTIGNKILYQFEHRYPIVTYLVAISVSKYNKYIQKAYLNSVNKEIDIINYVFPHDPIESNQEKTIETVKIMHLFDSLFGAYPFHKEHYGHAQFTMGGGMEHQTMSFMSNFNYDLIAHELAHQWFGDKVTCSSWQELWLNEGFATYLNLLCYDFLKPKSEWIAVLKTFNEDVMRKTNGSVYARDTIDESALFDYRTTYQKGAMILHQLRWQIGDQAFFNALKSYINDVQLSYSFANQNQLKYYLELNSGQNLTKYFNDWVFGEGYPIYKIQWEQKGKTLNLKINQTPSDKSVSQFDIPLPILIKGKNKDSLIRIPIEGLNFEYNIPIDFIVNELIFNPEQDIIAKASIVFPKNNNDLIKLYPNPLISNLFFSVDNADVESILIFDAIGRLVFENKFETIIPSNTISEINLNALKSGIYHIKLKTTDNRIINKTITKI